MNYEPRSNPIMRLKRMKKPKGRKIRGDKNPIVGVKFSKLQNGVVGAIAYGSPKEASKQFNSKSYLAEFEKAYPGEIFDYELEKKVVTGFMRGSDWKKIKPLLHPVDGSPYYKSKEEQARAVDEPPKVTVTSLLTGDSSVSHNNPNNPEIIITAPHTFDDNKDDGHDTDWLSEALADELHDSLHNRGVPVLLLKGEIDRDDMDLNRIESENHGFHRTLDDALPHADILFDIHSYPPYYPTWGDYDIVLFHNGPYHTDEDNLDTLELFEYIHKRIPDASIYIELANETQHYIQNKGLAFDLSSFLIEINENRTDLVEDLAEALADFALGVSPNPPNLLPEGARYHQFTISIPLSPPPSLKRLVFPEIMELEMLDKGFTLRKKTLDRATETITDFLTFGLPPGMDERPTIGLQRGKKDALLRKAEHLTNDEVRLIQDLIMESAEKQPIMNPFEPEKDAKKELRDMGIEGDKEINKVVKFIQSGNTAAFTGWNNARKKKQLKHLTPEQYEKLVGLFDSGLSENSTDKEIKDTLRKYNIDEPKKNNKFNRSKALQKFHIVGDFTDDEDLQKELNYRNIAVPKSGDKLDRKKALEKLASKAAIKTTKLADFVEAKPQKMKLSTDVTKSIMEAIIPGASKTVTPGSQGDSRERRIIDGNAMTKKEFQDKFKPKGKKDWNKWNNAKKEKSSDKKGKSQENDWSKDFKIVNGEKISKRDWRNKQGRTPNWDEWNNAPKANPPKDERKDFEEELATGLSKEEALEYALAAANDPELLDTVRQIATEQNTTRYLKLKWVGNKLELLITEIPRQQGEMLVAIIEPGYDSQWQKVFANPPVVAIPSEGKFVMDVTDEVVRDATISVIKGKPELDVQGVATGEILDKKMGNIIRINMFRKSAGFKLSRDDANTDYVISIETGGKHFYAKSKVNIDGLAILKHFPDKKSEPRLRVETRGMLQFGKKSGFIRVRGRTHDLYESVKISQLLLNPTRYAQQYIDDHIPIKDSKIPSAYKKYKLEGPIGSTKFFEQISSKMQNFGEGQGWVKDGHLYWRKGNNADNYVNVDGLMIEGGEAWMHTHPAAWEPSQTSPDDFKVMHGMFTNHGVKDFFTIIADRIDWFTFSKKEKLEDMVEVIEEFENDIETEFEIAESDFVNKMGEEPYLTSELTRYITKHLNKTIPEFQAKYRAYLLSPAQINQRTKKNPPDVINIRGFY